MRRKSGDRPASRYRPALEGGARKLKQNVPGLIACFCIVTASLSASEIKGKIVDPSGAPIFGAQIAVVNRVGVVAQTITAPNGIFLLDAFGNRVRIYRDRSVPEKSRSSNPCVRLGQEVPGKPRGSVCFGQWSQDAGTIIARS